MKIEITKEDLKDIISQDSLSDKLAEYIIGGKKDSMWNEFDKELLNAMEIATKRIVSEYMEQYMGEEAIQKLVRENIQGMTRQEIIEALKR